MSVVVLGFLLVCYSNLNRNVKETVLRENDAYVFSYGIHIAGLSIGEGTACTIMAKSDQVTFNNDVTDFNLSYDKLRDVTIKTETEIRNAYVSSIGGAIGGAVLFGTLGAIIGGRAKKKTDKTVKSFLIFTYDTKAGDIDYISFDITSDIKEAIKTKVAIKKMIQVPSSVAL